MTANAAHWRTGLRTGERQMTKYWQVLPTRACNAEDGGTLQLFSFLGTCCGVLPSVLALANGEDGENLMPSATYTLCRFMHCGTWETESLCNKTLTYFERGGRIRSMKIQIHHCWLNWWQCMQFVKGNTMFDALCLTLCHGKSASS